MLYEHTTSNNFYIPLFERDFPPQIIEKYMQLERLDRFSSEYIQLSKEIDEMEYQFAWSDLNIMEEQMAGMWDR